MLFRSYFIAVIIFVLTMSPLLYAKSSITGSDGVADSVISGGQMYAIEASLSKGDPITGIFSYVKEGFEQYFKFLGIIMTPYSAFLSLPGIYWLLKYKDKSRTLVIVSFVILSIPAFYAYSRGIQETRYLYVLYPFLSILAIFTIKFLQKKIGNIAIPIIISLVILSSIG